MITASEVLNPCLFNRLVRVFGCVKVSKLGEAMSGASVGYDFRRGRPRLDYITTGEYYRTCCLFCHDTRFRLYVSHLYGKTDGIGRRMDFLAWCANQNCLTNPRYHRLFEDRLNSNDGLLVTAPLRQGKVVTEAPVIEMPDDFKLLSELPSSHKARAYMQGRGFDPDGLARYYRVGYSASSQHWMANDRIIIPIYQGGENKGWQARYVGELPWGDPEKKRDLPPKYWFPASLRKSLLVYNLDVAKRYRTGVIMEGTTDIFAFGPMGLGTFGHSLSFSQQQAILAAFHGRTLILLYDPDVFTKPQSAQIVKRAIDSMRRSVTGPFGVVKLPEGTDPGKLSRPFLREYVAAEARKLGIEVSWGMAK